MKVSTREMRTVLPRLEEIPAREGEIVVTRRGKPIARVVSTGARRPMPSHSALRPKTARLDPGSEALIRLDRDER